MITVDEILKCANKLPDAAVDFPFEGDFFTRVFRRNDNKKWFGIILRAPEKYFLRYLEEIPDDGVILDLKCPPDLAEFLKSKYPRGILPAYHMNKVHWITVILTADIERGDIEQLIEISYNLADGKHKKQTQEKK